MRPQTFKNQRQSGWRSASRSGWPVWSTVIQCPHGRGSYGVEAIQLVQLIRQHQWIGLGEHLQENPVFNGKNHGFL